MKFLEFFYKNHFKKIKIAKENKGFYLFHKEMKAIVQKNINYLQQK